MTGFWPEQITEISNELSLIPAAIKCRRTGCYAVEVAPIRSWRTMSKSRRRMAKAWGGDLWDEKERKLTTRTIVHGSTDGDYWNDDILGNAKASQKKKIIVHHEILKTIKYYLFI